MSVHSKCLLVLYAREHCQNDYSLNFFSLHGSGSIIILLFHIVAKFYLTRDVNIYMSMKLKTL